MRHFRGWVGEMRKWGKDWAAQANLDKRTQRILKRFVLLGRLGNTLDLFLCLFSHEQLKDTFLGK